LLHTSAGSFFSLIVFAAARGSIWVKPSYTTPFGLMLCLSSQASFGVAWDRKWTNRKFVATAAALLAVVGRIYIEPLWRVLPHTQSIIFSQQPVDSRASECC